MFRTDIESYEYYPTVRLFNPFLRYFTNGFTNITGIISYYKNFFFFIQDMTLYIFMIIEPFV